MDRRTKRTRAAIMDAFGSLLCERGYSGLTVQDVLDRSHVSRSTFYAHFRGKGDLLALTVDSICEHALTATAPEHHHDFAGRHDPTSVVEHALCHLREREGGVRALLTGDTAELFARCLRHKACDLAAASLPPVLSGPAAQMDRSFLVHHVAASFVGAVRWWAAHDFERDPHLLARDYLDAIEPIFRDA